MRSITRPLVLTIAVLTTFAVRADVLNVPADFPTIQAAVDAAQSGDEIVLAPGTYESPGIMIDRSLQVTIRSTDPSDPGVVASTVLTDADDSGLMVVNAGEGESIDLSVRGLTIRRADVQNTDRFIELLGATSRFDRCRFEGGAGTTAAGTILVADRGMTDDLSASHVTNSEFVGDVGAAIYIDTTTSWTEVVVRDGNGRISWDAPDGHTLRLTDTSFSNLGVSSRPRVEIDHDVGPDTAVLERVSFTDIPGIGLRAEPSATLRDVVVERCGSLLSEIAFIEVTDLTIDGLVVRDCTLSEQQLVWFVYASRELVARNMLFEGNSGAELWLHGTTDDQEGGAIIEDSIFRNNISNIAVVEAHQSVTYRRCTFEGNLGGSPILIWGRATSGTVFNANILITECTFRNNSGFEAGGINLARGIVGPPVIVERSVFEGNTGGLGGAVSTTVNRWTGSSDFLWVVLRNSLIVGNTGGEGGSHHGNARYESSTVVDNAGGAAALGIGTSSIIDSIVVTDGTRPTIGDPTYNPGDDSQLTASFAVVPLDAQGTNTTNLDPLFVRPPNDGGDGWGDDPLTPGIDESLNDDFGDLRLRAGSPAIDAGSRGIMRFFETDLDGNDRLRDDPGIPDDGRNGRIDIGAYEFQGVTCLADVNGDGLANPADFNAWVIAYNANSPLADQNRDGVVNPADFNAWAMNLNSGCP